MIPSPNDVPVVFKCGARPWVRIDPPQDCDWPICGCDPYANKVLNALQERGEIERLQVENWQLKGALGYEVPSDIPCGDFKCGLCEAKTNEIGPLRTANLEMLIALKTALSSLEHLGMDAFADAPFLIRSIRFALAKAGQQ